MSSGLMLPAAVAYYRSQRQVQLHVCLDPARSSQPLSCHSIVRAQPLTHYAPRHGGFTGPSTNRNNVAVQTAIALEALCHVALAEEFVEPPSVCCLHEGAPQAARDCCRTALDMHVLWYQWSAPAPDVGSSRYRTAGQASMPAAMARRRFSPPDSPRKLSPPGSDPPTCGHGSGGGGGWAGGWVGGYKRGRGQIMHACITHACMHAL